MIHKAICLVCGILCLCPSMSWAQKEEKVHAIYTYSIGFDDNITLHDARLRSIELAKAEAIKAEFGELVTSDVIDTNGDYWENTVAKAKGNGCCSKPRYGDGLARLLRHRQNCNGKYSEKMEARRMNSSREIMFM